MPRTSKTSETSDFSIHIGKFRVDSASEERLLKTSLLSAIFVASHRKQEGPLISLCLASCQFFSGNNRPTRRSLGLRDGLVQFLCFLLYRQERWNNERENTGGTRYIPVNWFVLPRPQYASLTNHGGNSGAAVRATRTAFCLSNSW